MKRYGLAVVTFFLGAIAFWAITGFKNPFSTNGNGAPKEGAICTTGDGKPGKISSGVCVA